MAVRKVDHFAIAVRDTATALHLYVDVLGLQALPTIPIESEGTLVTLVGVDGTRLEILEPLAADTPVGRFLDRHGEGIHHLCFEVDDLGAACAELAARGYNVVDPAPRPGLDGRQRVFLHPRSTNGVLVELYQATDTAEGERT